MENPKYPESCHFRRSADVRNGYAIFRGRPQKVTFQVVKGLAIFEGDIVLGTVEQIEAITAFAVKHLDRFEEFGARLASGTWPRKTIPYCVAPATPHPDLIIAAATHWHTNTDIDISPLGPLCNAPVGVVPYPWPVDFVPGSGCSSEVGYQNRNQKITLENGCLFGQIVHEIGHTVGLFHEQSRIDRDQYVEIHYENIQDDMKFNFDINPAAVSDGPYDYGSIMHYGSYDFSKNNLPTIVPKQVGVTIGQRNGLSPGDIAAVRAMYP